jgi:hypothetical protein
VYNLARIMLGLLRALFKALVDIALLRRGPEEVPASPVLLGLVIAVYAGLVLFVAAPFIDSTGRAAAELALSVTCTLLFYRAVLHFARKTERFTQTMTALYGISALFSPVVLPMVAALSAQAKAQTQPPTLLIIGIFFLCIWGITVTVYILRSALEWPGLAAFGVLLGQNVLLLLLSALLFGAPPPAP